MSATLPGKNHKSHSTMPLSGLKIDTSPTAAATGVKKLVSDFATEQKKQNFGVSKNPVFSKSYRSGSNKKNRVSGKGGAKTTTHKVREQMVQQETKMGQMS